jgi:lysophosphatidate acyltransferase
MPNSLFKRVFPARASIMAKKELRFNPALGPWMTLSGAIWIDRGNSAAAQRSMTAAGNLMRALGTSLWMFPEGTRTLSETPSLKSFKKGAFHLAVQANLPIVPVVFENYWRLYHKGHFSPGVIKVRGAYSTHRGICELRMLIGYRLSVLPPVPTEGYTVDDIAPLIDKVRDQMIAALEDISVKVKKPASLTAEETSKPTPMPPPPVPPKDKEPIVPGPLASAGGEAEHPNAPEGSEVSSSSDLGGQGSSRTGRNGSETDDDVVLVDRPGSVMT